MQGRTLATMHKDNMDTAQGEQGEYGENFRYNNHGHQEIDNRSGPVNSLKQTKQKESMKIWKRKE